ncbi:unnamed protein product, partial [Didymodactylos carnosus]
WIEEVQKHTNTSIPMVLVGNKSDLVEQRRISSEQALMLAKQQNMSYMETSALNATNVEQAFTTLVTTIFHRKVQKPLTDDITPAPITKDTPDPVIIINSQPNNQNNQNKQQPKKNNGCC